MQPVFLVNSLVPNSLFMQSNFACNNNKTNKQNGKSR